MSSERGCAKLCLVVPCYNEEDALPVFFRTVIPALQTATDGAWQIICVDDGSSDGTFEIVTAQHRLDTRVTGLRLSRNFGHQAAVSVGLAFARGDYIGVIDCDLQDPVTVLIQLYETAVAEQLDVCYGIRARREAPLPLRAAYSLFYRVAGCLADHDWPKDAGDFCVISTRCHAVLLSLPEHSRMMRGLRSWTGLKQAGIPYERPARQHGRSKYSLGRLWLLATQGLIAFSSVPLRLATIFGLGMAAFSVLFGILILANRLVPRFSILGYWVGANAGVAMAGEPGHLAVRPGAAPGEATPQRVVPAPTGEVHAALLVAHQGVVGSRRHLGMQVHGVAQALGGNRLGLRVPVQQ